MTKKEISKQVLDKIKKHKIMPRSRLVFLLKQSVFWLLFTLSLFLGGLAMSVIISVLAHSDWDIYRGVNGHFLTFMAGMMPYFWLVILGLFILLVHYNLRHTKFGYRYRLLSIIVFYLLATVFLGSLFHCFGLGSWLEKSASRRVPYYHAFSIPKMKIWSQPGQGLLSGMVVSTTEKGIILEDFTKRRWLVELDQEQLETMSTGIQVKITGHKGASSSFKAEIVRPWCCEVMPPPGSRPMIRQILNQ